jgi:hypothetical protein
MYFAARHIIFTALMLLTLHSPAQNLTGTWEGDLGTDQFLQLYILQTGDKICGFTRDNLKKDTGSFCKAFFAGRYDKKRKMLIIRGKYFLETAGGHFLMKLHLFYEKDKGIETLEQPPVPILTTITYSQPSSGVSNPFDTQVTTQVEDIDSTEYVHLKKVSDKPEEMIDLMNECLAWNQETADSVEIKWPPKPTDSLPDSVKVRVPDISTDSIAKPDSKKDSAAVPKAITQRKNIEQSHLDVSVKTIRLKVYDNAIIDGDTISILYNGKMLLTHQLLSEKGIELNIELDEKQTRHEITLFAENLGSIPPNTALVVVTAGNKRYELFASASLEENAVLVFEYKPDK